MSPSEEWGVFLLLSSFHAVMAARAWVGDENSVSFIHSSRKLPLKLLTKPFCIGLPGGVVVPFDLCLLVPFEDGHAGPLRAVVRDDRSRLSTPGDQAVQSRASLAPDRDVSATRHRSFAGEIIDDRQNTQAAAVRGGVADEVQAAALFGARKSMPMCCPSLNCPSKGRSEQILRSLCR
ncbi:hypothetical protein AX760_17825 [Pararhizobium antarcticum]|uniref:Uncharacterized protein n=1 Tax=Pararhizobium antarcticum TaxID=1798805 RepID=A0A657LRS5_9HYPH|nr:hypothetical protein AX760_17825 [Pararhizobium antarcticum]OJF96754.1 hypothetical protein AX761_15665 [Rhizobium sp. 58]